MLARKRKEKTMIFTSSKFKAFNTRKEFKIFKSDVELYDFVIENEIEPRQEFWFIVEDDISGILWKSTLEYNYEG